MVTVKIKRAKEEREAIAIISSEAANWTLSSVIVIVLVAMVLVFVVVFVCCLQSSTIYPPGPLSVRVLPFLSVSDGTELTSGHLKTSI